MRKGLFTLSDDVEEFEGYVEGEYRGWANVCMTTDQVIEFLNSTPYDYKFEEYNLIVWWESNEAQKIEPSSLPTDDGDILVGYFLDLEWMEVEIRYDPCQCGKIMEYKTTEVAPQYCSQECKDNDK